MDESGESGLTTQTSVEGSFSSSTQTPAADIPAPYEWVPLSEEELRQKTTNQLTQGMRFMTSHLWG